MNPFQMISQYMNVINSNPLLKNVIGLLKDGKNAEAEQIARNFMQSQGKDFDKEYKQFMASMRKQ